MKKYKKWMLWLIASIVISITVALVFERIYKYRVIHADLRASLQGEEFLKKSESSSGRSGLGKLLKFYNHFHQNTEVTYEPVRIFHKKDEIIKLLKEREVYGNSIPVNLRIGLCLAHSRYFVSNVNKISSADGRFFFLSRWDNSLLDSDELFFLNTAINHLKWCKTNSTDNDLRSYLDLAIFKINLVRGITNFLLLEEYLQQNKGRNLGAAYRDVIFALTPRAVMENEKLDLYKDYLISICFYLDENINSIKETSGLLSWQLELRKKLVFYLSLLKRDYSPDYVKYFKDLDS